MKTKLMSHLPDSGKFRMGKLLNGLANDALGMMR
jgi:hypothetical protein